MPPLWGDIEQWTKNKSTLGHPGMRQNRVRREPDKITHRNYIQIQRSRRVRHASNSAEPGLYTLQYR